MTHPTFRLVGIVAAAMMAIPAFPQSAASTQSTPSKGTVSGTVLYRERVALPANAVVQVTLLDISRADAGAKAIANEKIATEGRQVPIRFTLHYRPAKIDASHQYRVRAGILVGGRLRFASATAYPVITQGAPTQVTILVHPVMPPKASAADKTGASLTGTTWMLTELWGKPMAPATGTYVAHIQLQEGSKRLTGSTGCNELMGSYEREGSALRFRTTGTTMMACPNPWMEREGKFLKALRDTTNFRIDGQKLELLHGTRVVAQFVAQGAK